MRGCPLEQTKTVERQSGTERRLLTGGHDDERRVRMTARAMIDIDTYAFMTTKPNASTRAINHERMPVLLSSEDQFEAWLSGSPAEAFALAQSFDPSLMRIVQSGTTKEDLLAALKC